MDYSLHLIPPAKVALPPGTAAPQVRDTDMRPDAQAQTTPPLPAESPYLAQAVAARLHSADMADPPGEILPDDRVLRPYGVPMLPADKPANADTPAQPDNADSDSVSWNT